MHCRAHRFWVVPCYATARKKKLQKFSPWSDIPVTYAAPELYSCFENEWELAQGADIYSLGCMLFELLDKRTFYTALVSTNGATYWEVVNNLRVGKEECGGNNEKRLALYQELLTKFAPAIIIPHLAEDSMLPEYVQDELQTILCAMCAFDYRKRTKEAELDDIKEKLRRIAHILEDAHLRALYKKRKEARRAKENAHA